MLEYIREHYTYDAETGSVYVDGEPVNVQSTHKCYQTTIRRSDPDYLTINCMVRLHAIGWYLTYGEWPPSDREIDHIDGDWRNNRINNLRLATRTEQNRNKGKKKDKVYTSQYMGVSLIRRGNLKRKWVANITVDYKAICLGRFMTEEEAARAYDTAARLYHGEFARYNFPLIETT